MPLITEGDIRAIGNRKAATRYKSAASILKEDRVAIFSEDKRAYTIFLSHSFRDQILILGLREYLQSLGYTVYVDWIDDRELDRSCVTKATTARLRTRMTQSQSLFFATTQSTIVSRWMPWELGYFDGYRNRCAILPLAQAPNTDDSYIGQEYLGLYPYIVRSRVSGQEVLYVHTDRRTWVQYDDWLRGKNPKQQY